MLKVINNPYKIFFHECKYTLIMFIVIMTVFEGFMVSAYFVNPNDNVGIFDFVFVFMCSVFIVTVEAFPLSVIISIQIILDKIFGIKTISNCHISVYIDKVSLNKRTSSSYNEFTKIIGDNILSVILTDSYGKKVKLKADCKEFLYSIKDLEFEDIEELYLLNVHYGKCSKVLVSFEI